jgi:hypothetical protein
VPGHSSLLQQGLQRTASAVNQKENGIDAAGKTKHGEKTGSIGKRHRRMETRPDLNPQ